MHTYGEVAKNGKGLAAATGLHPPLKLQGRLRLEAHRLDVHVVRMVQVAGLMLRTVPARSLAIRGHFVGAAVRPAHVLPMTGFGSAPERGRGLCQGRQTTPSTATGLRQDAILAQALGAQGN